MSQTPLLDQVKSEISASLKPVFAEDPSLAEVYDNICEPEQIHRWKAVWEDDNGVKQVNTCWRVQQNSALGPFKGGLRFDESVTIDVLRFLALEQVFKNALTGKSLGGGKGGSDFNPRGRSDNEIRRFCEAFMLGLHKIIGPDTDVPAGDIGVNSKVIGFLFGYWRKLSLPHVGVFSGKSLELSGSNLRTEATGYGIVYLLVEHLKHTKKVTDKEALKNKRILVSGSGNVATFCAKKCVELGGTLLSMSDRSQTYWCDAGFTDKDIDAVLAFKQSKGKKALPASVQVIKGTRPWVANKTQEIDFALPCATQNEVDESDAKTLLERGCKVLVEGSNLSSTEPAVGVYKSHEKQMDYIGSKLANLGGVGTSYLEMQQNSSKDKWPRERVDQELKDIMKHAYTSAREAAEKYEVSLTDGANIAAFLRVAEAMKQLGYA